VRTACGKHNKLTVSSIFIQNQFILLRHYSIIDFKPMYKIFRPVIVLFAPGKASLTQKEKDGMKDIIFDETGNFVKAENN
jgi:hypothetical protein